MGNSKFNASDASALFFSRLFKLSKHGSSYRARVKLYRNDLKRKKNYFELAGGSSYRGFELSRVKITVQSTPDDSTLQGKSKKGSSYREFEENSRE